MTLNRILKGFTKTIDRLESLVSYEEHEKNYKNESIQRLTNEIVDHQETIDRAKNISDKLRSIIE